MSHGNAVTVTGQNHNFYFKKILVQKGIVHSFAANFLSGDWKVVYVMISIFVYRKTPIGKTPVTKNKTYFESSFHIAFFCSL
jgi:hypothetical protein